MVGSLLGSTIVGPFADHFDPQLLFLIAVPFTAQIIYPIIKGHLHENVIEKGQRGFD